MLSILDEASVDVVHWEAVRVLIDLHLDPMIDQQFLALACRVALKDGREVCGKLRV